MLKQEGASSWVADDCSCVIGFVGEEKRVVHCEQCFRTQSKYNRGLASVTDKGRIGDPYSSTPEYVQDYSERRFIVFEMRVCKSHETAQSSEHTGSLASEAFDCDVIELDSTRSIRSEEGVFTGEVPADWEQSDISKHELAKGNVVEGGRDALRESLKLSVWV